MRIMTWNINAYRLRGVDYKNKVASLVTAINHVGADLMVITEAGNVRIQDELKICLNNYKFYIPWTLNKNKEKVKLGGNFWTNVIVAVKCKYDNNFDRDELPELNSPNSWCGEYSDNFYFNRLMTFRYNGINILGIYIPMRRCKLPREKLLAYMTEYAEKQIKVKAPSIILGDFNGYATNKDHETGKQYCVTEELTNLANIGCESQKWQDAWEKYCGSDKGCRFTHNHKNGGKFRLDYAFFSPKLIEEYKFTIKHEWIESSHADHAAVIIDLEKIICF